MIHHRRLASGFRACELDDGPTTSNKDDDTQDVGKVTCPRCQDSLRARNLLPSPENQP